jgi:hypothetical protein
MAWQSSDTDLARAQSCIVLSHALPLDVYAPQDLSFVPPGAGSGRFSCIFWLPLESPCNGIHCLFLLASAIVAMSKESLAIDTICLPWVSFSPFSFSFSFLFSGENSTTIASERYTISFESLLTTLMLFAAAFCGCRYGNNETMFLSASSLRMAW